jgi:ribosome-binding protein aMBF1 (putative translation factor)
VIAKLQAAGGALNKESLEEPRGDSLAEKRAKFILPLLRDKGMSRGKWATESGVDPSVVYDYLHGKSTLRPDSRKELADALGLKPSELPD